MSSPNKRRRVNDGDEALNISAFKPSELEEKQEQKMTPVVPLPEPIFPEFDEIASILMVDLHKNAVSEVSAALDELFDLITEEDDGHKNRTKACKLGAHSFVVATMQKWTTFEEVQAAGCLCLGMLAYHKTLPVVKCGGVEAAIYAMKVFPQSRRVQSGACTTLLNTLHGCESKPKAVRRVTYRFVKEIDGVSLVLKALQTFPDEEDVRQCVLRLYRNILVDKLLRDAVVKAGILPTVADTLKKYLEDEDVQNHAKNIILSILGKTFE